MTDLTKKRGGGRPAYQPTDETGRQVEMLAGIGVPEEMMARMVGIDRKTLLKYYRHEIDNGAAKATTKVAKRLFDIAMSDSKEALTACIFWLKCRARWSTLDGPETQINLNSNVQNNTAILTNREPDQLKDFKRRWDAITAD